MRYADATHHGAQSPFILACCRHEDSFVSDENRVPKRLRAVGFSDCRFFQTERGDTFPVRRETLGGVLAVGGTTADGSITLDYDAVSILMPSNPGEARQAYFEQYAGRSGTAVLRHMADHTRMNDFLPLWANGGHDA